jgi:hypothetical protein
MNIYKEKKPYLVTKNCFYTYKEIVFGNICGENNIYFLMLFFTLKHPTLAVIGGRALIWCCVVLAQVLFLVPYDLVYCVEPSSIPSPNGLLIYRPDGTPIIAVKEGFTLNEVLDELGTPYNYEGPMSSSEEDEYSDEDENPNPDNPNPINRPTIGKVILKYTLGATLVVGGIFLMAYVGPKLVKSGIELAKEANENLSMVLQPA